MGKIITKEGAYSAAECEDCGPGFICTQADPIPQPCLPGWYVPPRKFPK